MTRSGPPYWAAIWFVLITGAIGAIAHTTLMTHNNIVFSDGASDVIRIDGQGFHYRGQFVEDAGEAHRLLVEFLRKHLPETDWKHAN